MKKNGFTLVELVTTFALASVLIILLINIVLIIKDIYTQSDIEGKLIVEKGSLIRVINRKFDENILKSYSVCDEGDFCYKFNYENNMSSILTISNDKIRFDNHVYKLIEGSSIGALQVETKIVDTELKNVDNSFLIIRIPILHKLYGNKNFGINIVYTFNSNETSI